MPRYMLRCNAYSYIRKIIHELNGPIHTCFFTSAINELYQYIYTDSSASYSENDYLMGHFTIHFYYNYHYIIWPNKQNKTFTDYFINWGVHSYRIQFNIQRLQATKVAMVVLVRYCLCDVSDASWFQREDSNTLTVLFAGLKFYMIVK